MTFSFFVPLFFLSSLPTHNNGEHAPSNRSSSIAVCLRSHPFISFIVIMVNAQNHHIKAVLFDLDGTLLDTEALSDKAMLRAFGSLLSPEIVEQCAADGGRIPWELKKQILGLRGSEWAPIALNYAHEKWQVARDDASCNKSSVLTVQGLWATWEERLNELCEEVTACPGASELVDELAKAGIPMAIATSSRKAAVAKKRKRHEDMIRHISAIVPGDDAAVKKGKPAPDIYLEAARQLGVDPKDCLVFEDALSGVRAGNSAGCYVVAVPDPRFTAEEKSVFVAEADVVLDSLWDFSGKEWAIDVDMPSVASKNAL